MAYTMHLPRRSPLVLGLGCVALFLAACQHTGVQQGEPEALGSHVGATADGTPLGNPEVILETSRGTMTVRLFGEQAPESVKNFLAYVDTGFFEGTIFHRVIPDFMIQGGGFTADLKQKATRAAIANEAGNGLKNKRGTLAMARTNVVSSATAQFFINTKDNAQLDHRPDSYGYAVFGEVIGGLDVVDAIRAVPTRCPSWIGAPCTDRGLPNGMMDVPTEAVTILKVKRKS